MRKTDISQWVWENRIGIEQIRIELSVHCHGLNFQGTAKNSGEIPCVPMSYQHKHSSCLWYVSAYCPYLRFHTANFKRGATHQRCAWQCSKASFIFPDSQRNWAVCGSWCRHLWPVAVSSRFTLRRIFA